MKQLTIFINDKPCILTEKVDDALDQQIVRQELLHVVQSSTDHFEKLISNLGEESINGFVIETNKFNVLKNKFFSLFELIKAGGGVVTNPAGEVLLIFRKGKWDLPKGKLDDGETIEACALREVSEETGLKNIKLQQKILNTYHTYTQKQDDILKETSWYKMDFTGDELTIPQIEEEILDIQWIKPGNLPKYLKYSYNSIRLVLQSAGFPV